ncbi:TPA: hypothetical protein QDA84_000468 [Burkholderia vietnamiensis]|nr:hypothetical protein [Burkholderia vietnamiensis]
MTTTDNSRADALTDAVLNQLIDLGAEAKGHQVKSMSNDGHAGTEAWEKWHELRDQMRAILAASPVEQHEAAPGHAAPDAFALSRQATLHEMKGFFERMDAIAKKRDMAQAAPFANCQFRVCDLPGQCRAEGACHHPKPSAPLEGTGNGADEYVKFDPRIEDPAFMAAWPEISKAGHDYGWLGIGLAAWGAARAPRTEVAGAVPAAVIEALRFYAHGHHFSIDDDHQQFDTVSGEPQNWLMSERDDDCTMIEDGSIAKAALCGGELGFEEPTKPVEGEVLIAAPPSADAAAAPADERAALVERVLGMFEAWPKDWRGPTDEPESQYRFGYNTALEDVLTALDVPPAKVARAAASQPAAGSQCKLCRSSGPDLPCAYPTEINRQQAKRIAVLEAQIEAAAGQEAVVIPAGWQLVPIEPTAEILQEIWRNERDSPRAWRDALRAAPQPPAQVATRRGLTDEQIRDISYKFDHGSAMEWCFSGASIIDFARALLEGAKR